MIERLIEAIKIFSPFLAFYLLGYYHGKKDSEDK